MLKVVTERAVYKTKGHLIPEAPDGIGVSCHARHILEDIHRITAKFRPVRLASWPLLTLL